MNRTVSNPTRADEMQMKIKIYNNFPDNFRFSFAVDLTKFILHRIHVCNIAFTSFSMGRKDGSNPHEMQYFVPPNNSGTEGTLSRNAQKCALYTVDIHWKYNGLRSTAAHTHTRTIHSLYSAIKHILWLPSLIINMFYVCRVWMWGSL